MKQIFMKQQIELFSTEGIKNSEKGRNIANQN